MSVRRSRDSISSAGVGGFARGVLARITHTLGSRYADLLHLASTYTDRWGRTLPDRRDPNATKVIPRSDCNELRNDYVQLLARCQRLEEALAEERVIKAEAQKALIDLEAAHVMLEQQDESLYNELLKTRRNRDRLRDENVLLKNRIRSMKRLNGLVRDAYTRMATAYLDGVADGRLVKRAKRWLER